MRPRTLEPGPSFVMATVGGAVAGVLLLALLYGAPALGGPAVDVLGVTGGVFTSHPEGALAVGAIVYLLAAWLLVPALYVVVWPGLPGGMGLGGAVARGALWGAALWGVIGGALLPLLGALNRVPEVTSPGPLAVDLGGAGAAVLLGAHMAYGLALALVSHVGQGLAPLDAIGWEGYRRAEHRSSSPRGVPS